MDSFRLHSDFVPSEDQKAAIDALSFGLEQGFQEQTLLGVTGSGKTFTMANIIARLNRPTIVIAHNKTLAAQLCAEFKEFFPENAVEYFVSYFDYYQPEAYIPHTDTYIEKDSAVNDEIDRLRHSATTALFERRDVIIVASVSCIYGLGDPEDYSTMIASVREGMEMSRDKFIRRLVDIHYERNDVNFTRSKFRVRGDTVEVIPSSDDKIAVRVEFFGDEVDRISEVEVLTGKTLRRLKHAMIYPANHHTTTQEKTLRAIGEIERELEERVAELEKAGKILEAQRLTQRTNYDIEMMQELGYCSGIENYSRILSGRTPGSAPYTLLDYFPKDYLMFIDESHVSLPQIRGMPAGDRARKQVLVDYGFRLPSAFDNRPLYFEEFQKHIGQVIYVSATPQEYEKSRSSQIVEQLIRPTGLLDPEVEVRPTENQVDDLLAEIAERKDMGERVLVTTLTKNMAEELTAYLTTMGVRVRYMHHQVENAERIEIIRDLRLGAFDVLVGINLLREGLDIPEVSLICILDADKEGFLRSETSLIQIIGRAARNVHGKVILYGDRVTPSMASAMRETERRRALQDAYNREHNIIPRTIVKSVREAPEISTPEKNKNVPMTTREREEKIAQLEKNMREAAKLLDFELAAELRDEMILLKGQREAGKGKG